MESLNYNQPTEPQEPEYQAPYQQPAVGTPTTPLHASTMPSSPGAPNGARVPSRRRFMSKTAAGIAALAGLGAAAAVGGAALEQWIQGGGLSNIFHDPLASEAQIGHLLRRAGFGATPDELTMYRNLGFSGAVDRLLNYQQVSDDAMESRLNALNLDLNLPVDQQRWWLLRMAWTQRPLVEKMTLFWHGVLTSAFTKVGGKTAYMRMIIQNNFLRAHAFDTFDNIMLGITSDPAMLFYLDLTKSHKTAPNENYAREMMELFTIGLGNYSQRDVSEGAAALTGWHIRGLTSYYNLNDHNNLTKVYLGHTGNLDYKDVINILVNNPATPWFIARKLFTYFVYENPSSDDLKPLVDAYTQSGHNMGAVMRALLLSPQFSSAQAYRSRVKSPVEFTVGAYRALGIQGNGTGLPQITTLMGQTLFNPPNVAGWPGDKVSSLWLNSGTWMTRLNYIDLLLLLGAAARGDSASPIDLQAIVDSNKIASPDQFVDYFSSFLYDGVLDSSRRSQLINYFTASGAGRSATQVTLTNGQSYPINHARGTLYLMMTAPEYHLN
ncbi:MAG TPA: DUF1800 domain-containing protein [Ktedonobacteraceae bacterium]|nr:DUF1800 domain-containing protein [Ktedonobacteraceae bacterium]